MNLQWKSIKKRERLATRGRVLGVKWMKTVFADVKLWVLGRSEPLPLVLQSMMSGITCQLITKTGRAFFTPYLHTKNLQVALCTQYFFLKERKHFNRLLPLKVSSVLMVKNAHISNFEPLNAPWRADIVQIFRIIYVNLLCQYFCLGLRTRGCVETEAWLCLSENTKRADIGRNQMWSW